MRRPTPLLTTAAIALLGLAGLAGCGDTTPDKPAADKPAASGSGAAVDCAAHPGKTVTVEIPEFKFAPNPVQIAACDSVVWKNTADQAHTSTGKGAQAWSTGNITPGSASEPVLFADAGSFAYICALHPFMKGAVEVS
ncbi:MAG: plastocyanin/azurin family copper-binding protein [Acidimicrobiales bacterium]